MRRHDGTRDEAVVDGAVTAVGGLEVEALVAPERVAWALRNDSPHDLALDAVQWVCDLGPAGPWPRMFCNGYQSWSETRTSLLGVASDQSRHPRSFDFIRTLHHADPRRAAPRELRSEMVTVLLLAGERSDAGNDPIVVGFAGGSSHEGTLRAEIVDGRVELRAEAWLGGAVIRAGGRRELHDVVVYRDAPLPELLDAWAREVGSREGARTAAPYQVGWCSWYHYFHDIDERALRDNLARSNDWPFMVFQLDDGYQRAIGDWLRTNDKFDGDTAALAPLIAANGREPGLWLAPFLAAPDSDLAREHPEYLARDIKGGEPLTAMFHDVWGGAMWELDTTLPDTLAHLESTARALRAAGFTYFKLDFTFSPTFAGTYHDPTRTPAERVRAGYEAVRRGAGDDAFVLACGCPLGSVVGVVDAMRIGPDVAPSWEWSPHDTLWPGYEAAAPSTRAAWNSTLARSFMHRRLWLNDPDCLMLREHETAMTSDQIRAWSLAVAQSGGLALVSDDLALLDAGARSLLDDVVAIGRAADSESIAALPPRCDDLLSPAGPTTLRTSRAVLRADPADPHPTLEQIS